MSRLNHLRHRFQRRELRSRITPRHPHWKPDILSSLTKPTTLYDAYGKWLDELSQRWTIFGTVTASPYQPRTAKSWRRGMNRFMTYYYPDADYDIRPHTWFWGVEPHKSKVLHVHYLAEIPGYWELPDKHKYLVRREYWSRSFEWFGRSNALEFDHEKKASHYCTKYCIKGQNKDWEYHKGGII